MLGALGRLEGLGYVKRSGNKKSETIVLAPLGDQILASLLESLPESSENWDRKWRIILFDVPEKQRTVRQMFRLKLLDLGARMFQSSVWISPSPKTVEKFKELVTQHGFDHAVFYFEAHSASPQTIDVAKLWQLTALKHEYKDLFTQFKQLMPKLKDNNLASYYAKCMIVALALTSKKDPHLPSDTMPPEWIGKEASNWHAKLRPYCKI